MQTGREAINALFNKQKADHVPFYDLVWGEAVRFKPSQRLEPEVLDKLLGNQPPPGAGQ